VIIPEENQKDLAEIPDNVKAGLNILPVRWIDKVLDIALESQPAAAAAKTVAQRLRPSPPAVALPAAELSSTERTFDAASGVQN
jgi:ATP-dependent Lon protease